MTETLDIHDINRPEGQERLKIERQVIEYAMRTRNLTEAEWVASYAREYDMFYTEAVAKGYDEAVDDNLDTFLEWIQVRLESAAMQKAA